MTTPPVASIRSCAECPGCLPAAEVLKTYGANFGADTEICGSFGHVLSVPGQSVSENLKIKRKLAHSCPGFGENRARLAVPPALVAIADPPLPTTDTQLSHCNSCVNFVPARVTQQGFGWSAPMCGASGRLMLENRLNQEPKSCGYAEFGPPRTTTNGLVLSPMMDPEFVPSYLVVDEVALATSTVSYVEPLEYPTDRPVNDDDRAFGIRAWRKFQHPRLGDRRPPLWLPIFDPSTYTEDEQAMIPQTGDDTHPELYVDHQNLLYTALVALIGLDASPVLTGESGTGKTELFRHLAWLTQMPFVRISLNKNVEPGDIVGETMFENNETVWYDGRLTASYRRPYVICLDEWNTAPDALLQALRPLTDNSKQLVLESAKGKGVKHIVARHPYCLVGMTQNPSWDLRYSGLNQLSDADETRVSWIAVDMPSEEVERSIIVHHCLANGYEIEAKTLDAIMEIARDIRQLTDPRSPKLNISWALRPQVKVAQSTQYQSLMEAYKMHLIDRLPPNDADTIRNFVTRFES